MTRSRVLLGLVLACAGCRSGGDEGEGADESAQPDPVPTPRFTDPANLSKVVFADRNEPIELGIADARADLWVEIDGERFDPSPGGAVERIGESGLQLRVEGSLLALLHDVRLAQRDGAEVLRSESLTLGVVASELGSVVALADAGAGSCDHIDARGQAERALLGRLSGETLTLQISEAQASAWAWSSPIASVDLPGIASDVHSWSAIVEAGQPWIAWRVALPTGESAVRMRVGEAGEVQTLWHSDDPQSAALFGSHEYASLDAVAWQGRSALITAQAIRDVERATPGDRVLVLRRVDASGELSNPAQVVRGPGSRDIDSLTPALDLAELEPRMLVRLARALPWSLSVSSSGLPVLDEEPGAIELADDLRWLGSIDGALGSRQAVWISSEGLRLGVVRIDRLLDRSAASEVELAGAPSGPPALAVLAGVPTIVIPRGADQPIQVLRSTGAELELTTLAGPSCDEVALLVSAAGSKAGALPFACLAAGELLVGELASPL